MCEKCTCAPSNTAVNSNVSYLALVNLSDKVDAIEIGFDEMNSRLDVLDVEILRLEDVYAKLNSQFDTLDSQIKKIDDRLTSLASIHF